MSLKLIYRLFVALAALIGVSIQITQDGWGMLLYYTVLSNALVFSFFFYLVYQEWTGQPVDTENLLRFKGNVTMAIMITLVVYNILLAPIAEPEEFWRLRNFLVHYIAPIGVIIDTLFLDKKAVYHALDPIRFSLFPLLYFIFAIINGILLKLPIPGAKDSPYAYFFINVNKYGLSQVLINAFVICLIYIAVGYGFMGLKRFIGKP